MLIFSRKFRWAIYIFLISLPVHSDNFQYNSYNNHGSIGLINMPTARFYDEAAYGITIYNGTPDQKITFTTNPYDWLEASIFYTNLENKPYCFVESDPVCDQDAKDKGFNFKFKLKKEGIYPGIAVGINDIAGTGYYSSEYIVASYGIKNIDFHFGLAWGSLNGSLDSFNNPFGYFSDRFKNRPSNTEDKGGQFQPSRYFSGKNVSPFYGFSIALSKKLVVKIENDTTLTPGKIDYSKPKSDFSFGVDYQLNNNLVLGLSQERDDYLSFRFIYKNDLIKTNKTYEYIPAEVKNDENQYIKLIKNLENNGIGVNKIIENSKSIGLELSQFTHPNLDVIEEIIATATAASGVNKEIKKDMRIANLKAISEYDGEFERNSRLIYERERIKKFDTNTKLAIRPFIASREEFFKVAILVDNNSEYVIRDNFFFSSNIKYTIKDNFGDLIYKPVDTYPAQVRSDVKEYLKNFENRFIIGRAQFDYHISTSKNNHFMLSAGILEEMFSGYGLEYLYFDNSKNYAIGFELFNVKKRDYDLRLGSLNYQNITGHINLYYRNYEIIPFDAKVSFGEYLAGDTGATFEISRAFSNGAEFGVFASFTDVTTEQFGEGTFDKGIFFNIPIYKNFVNYTWRPLTKDPGAKLNRKHTLHDLLIKFKSFNS